MFSIFQISAVCIELCVHAIFFKNKVDLKYCDPSFKLTLLNVYRSSLVKAI